VATGWLLTPLWAWGASYFGLWLGALLGLQFNRPFAMIGTAALTGAVLGFGALWGWVRFMRRVPHLLSHRMAPRASQEQAAIAAAD
jgi:hypothetical protein